MQPSVCIVILNWNGLNDTIECLESLKKINYKNYRIIVVDNGSKNDEGKILKEKFGDYIYLIQNDKNYGFAEGNNIGMKYALKNGADYVLLLNNDTIVESNFLDELVKAISKHNKDRVEMAACKILNYPDKKTINAVWSSVYKRGLFRGKGYGITDRGQYNKEKIVFGPSGCCALYSKKLLEDTKIDDDYFDKSLFAYHEDIDLNFRAQLRDWKCIYAPKSVIYHKHSQSLGKESPKKSYLCLKNNLIVLFKNLPKKLFLKYFFYIILYQILSFGYHLLTGKIMGVKGQIQGIKDFPKYSRKRQIIQKNKKVSNKYIASILN
ncbi:MAG: glycosyltransferase family 2 protein [Patescibacteria group bacterium]